MQLRFIKILFICFITLVATKLNAQGTLKSADGTIPTGNFGNRNSGSFNKNGGDSSFQHRNDAADSITIFYRLYNQNKTKLLDTSISNFNARFPLPNTYYNLGNLGTAAQSYLFNPLLTTGFGAGFHQFDVYNYTLENTRLFETTKPYTELAYLLGKNAEQLINVLHTQNKKNNLNFSLEYRFLNAPGVFKNQNASLNNTRFALQYQSPSKRYHLQIIYIANKNAASENGGVVDNKKLDSLSLGDPFELQVRLGANNIIRRNLFSTQVYTGNTYEQSQFMVRQQYDLGQKDSIVTDSSVVKLFYPKLRLQHTINIKKNVYNFNDIYADSANYQNYFGLNIKGNATNTFDTISNKDAFSLISNELSIISFPDKKNAAQFLKASAIIENITGTFNDINKQKFYNISVGGEYRNRTKNKIWDIETAAQFYVNGFNAGDYKVEISLQKLLNKKTASLEIGFQNVNRTPEFIYNNSSSFYVSNRGSYNKENTTKFWGNYYNSKLDLKLTAQYFVMSNYLYFDSFFTAKQEATLFNVLHFSLDKKIKLAKNINWYAQIHLQQTTANAPINIPNILTINRFAFEGNFYQNLFLSTGLEVRYHSNYKPSGYSPMNGQFYYQNSYSTANMPDINFFFNFKIKSFKAFLRVENLNTLFSTGSKKYNYVMKQYPMQAVWLRFGVWWNFVN